MRTSPAREDYGFHRMVKGWVQPRAGVASRLNLAESNARTGLTPWYWVMPRFMMTSVTPFAGYDVDRGREVAVVTDIHKVRTGWQKRRSPATR
jgi:hypothetical protein